jgi:5'(3')-deoxyribonucleotidase
MKSSTPCKRTVFIDLDGVMVDWYGGVADLIGDDPHIFKEIYLNDPEASKRVNELILLHDVWGKIESGGPEWWANLNPLPWAAELWLTMKKMGNVCVCTSSGDVDKYPATAAASSAGKCLWMGRHLPEGDKNRFAICPRKQLLAHPNAVLIDDFKRNTKNFTRAGGYGLLWENQYRLMNMNEIQRRVYIEMACTAIRAWTRPLDY